MRLKEIGEFGLIKRIKDKIKTGPAVIKGIGDDCAVVKFKPDEYLLLTCDMLVEGVDFIRSTPAGLIGRKALAISISDIAACGGIPHYALVSLGLPKNSSVELVDKIYSGLRNLAGEYNINIVGGDISKARALTLDVSLTGTVEKKNLVLRSGAKVGDVIFVTGRLGGSIFGKHLKFVPRLEEARFLVENFKINSMIDISDGLAQDLGHIAEDSRVGALIYERLIPRSKAAVSFDDALSSGEDFELLFTLSSKEANRLTARKLKVFTPIGFIIDKRLGLRLFGHDGRQKIIKPKGYTHF